LTLNQVQIWGLENRKINFKHTQLDLGPSLNQNRSGVKSGNFDHVPTSKKDYKLF